MGNVRSKIKKQVHKKEQVIEKITRSFLWFKA